MVAAVASASQGTFRAPMEVFCGHNVLSGVEESPRSRRCAVRAAQPVRDQAAGFQVRWAGTMVPPPPENESWGFNPGRRGP
jgi:hypothetical protein